MMKIKEVYDFYNENVKPIYSEIEARDNELPVELLFEIHSCFDHLKRFYIDGEDEDAVCKKALGHLKRGTLDGFKLKLKNFNDDLENFTKTQIDISLIDSGEYIRKFYQSKMEIIKLAKQARINESMENKDLAFSTWTDASLKIDDFETTFFNEEKLQWAKKKTKRLFSKDMIIGLAVGIASSAVVSVVFHFF